MRSKEEWSRFGSGGAGGAGRSPPAPRPAKFELFEIPLAHGLSRGFLPVHATMKRKLNEIDVPEPVQQQKATARAFGDLGLDSRLLQAINREKFAAPTPIQQKAIPVALQGKDVVGELRHDLFSELC